MNVNKKLKNEIFQKQNVSNKMFLNEFINEMDSKLRVFPLTEPLSVLRISRRSKK